MPCCTRGRVRGCRGSGAVRLWGRAVTRRDGTGPSRRLSWLLRHGAGGAGLAMDAAGWAAVDDVLRVTGLTRPELVDAVSHNDKGRLQLDGGRIRACQGHSAHGMPVTRDALEATWERIDPEGDLWHGTSLAALPGIGRSGIRPGARTHVHLADSTASRVGKRANVDVLLRVSAARLRAAGVPVYRAPNGVVLVEHVPVDAVTGVVPRRIPADQAARACRQAGITPGAEPQSPSPSPSADRPCFQ